MQNQAAVQPTPDFTGAAIVRAPLGIHGEITRAIDLNLPVPAFTANHIETMKFYEEPSVHEALHVCIGFLEETHPELMIGKSYQADSGAEAYVTGMERFIINPEYGREMFIEIVQENARLDAANENTGRILSWTVSEITGEPVFHFKREDISNLKIEAEAIGINWELVQTTDAEYEKNGSVFKITSKTHGEFTASRSGIDFPENFVGKDQIVPFLVPSYEEAGKMFDALEPILIFLREKLKNDVTKEISVLSDVTTGQLVALLRGGKSAEPKPAQQAALEARV